MEREEIIEKSRNLPAIHPEKIAEDHEIWEGNEPGAHFKFTKNYLPQVPVRKFYVLSVAGKKRGRERIISDFKSVFGEPERQYTLPRVPAVYFLSWDTGKVDASLTSKE